MYSGLYTIATAPEEGQGYVILGTIDGLLYVHYGPGVTPPEDATPIFVPDAPFRWEDFAAAHPALAPRLMPHQWMGEST